MGRWVGRWGWHIGLDVSSNTANPAKSANPVNPVNPANPAHWVGTWGWHIGLARWEEEDCTSTWIKRCIMDITISCLRHNKDEDFI